MRVVLECVEARLLRDGEDAAIAYLLQALPDASHLKRIRPDATPTLRIAIYKAIADLHAGGERGGSANAANLPPLRWQRSGSVRSQKPGCKRYGRRWSA